MSLFLCLLVNEDRDARSRRWRAGTSCRLPPGSTSCTWWSSRRGRVRFRWAAKARPEVTRPVW